ncbi:hypothetical protein Ava_D0008 [Trichormus variabilis ATCC 29413]|uniref:Uncharacterized protein n=2 Tax=Anabaena variabilis TaxID=264691 RepID=Q3M2W3_TRIV2|nr:hypothetical protein [Trichormus variabilis]ABA24673.1 hypothetical protein Ava_D0008 [Trichormus variabilis ATCC 29413]MBC1217708.1 hypothetical protein [Trichormus variabilis ARAD]MBC1259001.1 hypothetical protein [Trichormus variabilis V5]MBC1302712.1 hypothetical protein [Trichormus variabilis N2B]MBC1324567.1 hypothetical protein [Trichormus variabilis 9RC]
MTQPLFPGNQTQLLNWYNGERLECYPKILAYHALGYATITSSLQTQIDIFVPSHQRDRNDTPLIVPAGAQVYYIGLRTPNVALIGTTGERLKVAAAHTDTAPVLTVASSAIAANSSARSVATPYDTLAAPLGTLGGATQYRLLNSNAGNTVAGTGVRVASGTQRVICDVCYLLAADPSRLEQVGYPSTY